MKLIKCECCGGNEFTSHKNVMVCDHCGSTYRVSEDERILSKELTDANVYSLLVEAETCRQKDDVAGVMKALTNALDYDDKNAVVWNDLGRAYRRMGEYQQAIDCYKKTIELNPDFPYGYCNMGVALIGTKDYEGAVRYLQTGISMTDKDDSEYPTQLANYGVALGLAGNKKEGRKMIVKAEMMGYKRGKEAMEAAGIKSYGRIIFKMIIRILKIALR